MTPPGDQAREAGLRYVSDEQPGITRRRVRKHFVYEDADGNEVDDDATLARIRGLAIPPAWEDIWICPRPNGHIQATGRDARNRKQYRYHPDWRAYRDDHKFGRMVAFGEALPRIRRKVEADLDLPELPRDKVLAAVVRLLETTAIRIGNVQYARENDSYGLTTLRSKHVQVVAERVEFDFRAKSGKQRRVEFRDQQLAEIVRRLVELPGWEVFKYIDDDGDRRTVDSADVNEYIRDASGGEFSAKDYRTWLGTVLAAMALEAMGPFDSKGVAKRRVNHAMDQVADALGNTRAVCRKSYVHPALIEAYLEDGVTVGETARGSRDLVPEERATLAFLRSLDDKKAPQAA